jgi:predicted DNA-binding ribbon-helix-helix protein
MGWAARRLRVLGSRLVNRNIMAGRGRTSMRLEPELWASLEEICAREGVTMATLIRRIEDGRDSAGRGEGGRTSAVRIFALQYFRSAATEQGHALSGHGHMFVPLRRPAAA